jgi:hypothetical protein
MARPSSTGQVVSIGARGNYRPSYKRLASAQVTAAREKLGMTPGAFAAHLSDLLGWTVAPKTVERWEGGSTPPGDVMLACTTADQVPELAGPLLTVVPPSFPADELAGSWVTCYQFTHAGELRHHADIAHVTIGPGGRVRAVNHPPEPRSEGRARPFRNQIDAELTGRHLVGTWTNSSDTRYYGALQLAVLPGETVMEGIYTGVGSDIEVSTGWWRWVRLDSSEDAEIGGITLREPSAMYDAVMSHSQYGEPLTLADIGEEQ